ncbi:MAG TPA: methanogenesis marker 7 protein [Methanomicrobia archaeon]|nr:methanogenesis marker 7 protein [Methanomicrobia archaeon]
MYKIMMFEGGVYKFNELKELVEDIGGFILQESVMQTETMLHMAFPDEEEKTIRNKIKDLGGKFKELPLAGTEVMVVSPSLGKHHAVNPMCDVAEYLRRQGAITIVMGLARGVGKRIAQITVDEKKIIEEADAAVFVFGNFTDCIREKAKLCEQLDVPYLIVGGPPDLEVPHYTGGIGRRTDRLRRAGDIECLERMTTELAKQLDERRVEVEEDPLAANPLFVKEMIEMLVPAKAGEELPITVQLDGLRVIINEEDLDKIQDVEIGTRKLSEIATISKSFFRGYLVKIRPESEVGSIF